MVTKIMNHSWLPKVEKSAEHGEYAQGTLKAFPRNTRYKNSFKRCFNHGSLLFQAILPFKMDLLMKFTLKYLKNCTTPPHSPKH